MGQDSTARGAALQSDAYHLEHHWDDHRVIGMLNLHPRESIDEDGYVILSGILASKKKKKKRRKRD